MHRHSDLLSISRYENTETVAEVLLLAVYHTVISLQNLTTNEHVPNLSDALSLNIDNFDIIRNDMEVVSNKDPRY